MKVGIVKEIHPGERRVAATPDTVKRLKKFGFDVMIETNAGLLATFSDDAYRAEGADIAPSAAHVWSEADIVIKVREPEMNSKTFRHEADMLREGGTLISFIWPAQNEELLNKLAARKATVIAMDCVPRISRAQKLDALSSMANIGGYRAVVEAANRFGRFFTGQITAAGKVPPAKVLVIGAGVAGLAAIGAARGLGAIVRSFDTRPAVKEQVESMGAEFLFLDFEEDGEGQGGYAKVMSKEFIEAEMKLFAQQAKEVDIIITTALIPGKPAPRLILKEAVELMKPGSVIVDMAAERGGNCEVTKPGECIVHNGVTVIGFTDLASRMADVSSNLYGSNICHMLDDMGRAENYKVDMDDEVVRGALVLREGEVTWPPPKPAAPPPAAPKPAAAAPPPAAQAPAAEEKKGGSGLWLAIAGALLIAVGWGGNADFLSHFTVFVLACFVGWQVIWNVSPALHTPLMSVTNAISGIIIVGGMLQIGGPASSPAAILGAIAICVATINIAGGFLVTQRMLKMFRR
ncbi:MAG: Re/Si-specific NAD(P)(+) transhydrogenase subunit alpha [Myxococcales bacterium FL481]|nr:MAG: Re/Si-specific NAD(P)(+) transhydrogenase subunit alpha [Myxococcales bacterium FL481]